MIQRFWERIFPPVKPLPAGIYHCQMPSDERLPYRLHLRIEPDGRGVLIVNASTVVHLNQTAAEYAYHLVNSTPEDQAVAEMARRYNVRKEIILRDYYQLIDRLKKLVDTPDLDPVAFLDFERQDPYTEAGSAPYRIDCALTYRLPDQGSAHLAPQDRVTRELTSEEWESILQKAWDAGVPHVIFTGGEPTLRPDLSQLITHSERLGMVAGLITDGLRLSESKYLHNLLQSGLDHVMILLDPGDEQCWEALRDTLAEDISVTAHLTLTERYADDREALLDRLQKMGLQNISLSAASLALKDALQAWRQSAAERQIRLIWDMPAPYSHFHPVAVELADDKPEVSMIASGNGRAWLYVEPDGDVLPGQGAYQSRLGNLLTDSFEAVWQQAQRAVE